MNFDLQNLSTIEFSIKTDYRDQNGEPVEVLYRIATDKGVKKLLKECLETTLRKFPNPIEDIPSFEFSEKYSDKDRFQLTFETYPQAMDVMTEELSDHVFLSDIRKESIQYYRVDFIDAGGNKITGIRRASYFKSLLKNKSRIVQFLDDALRAVDDELFKLDNDFDFIAYNESIYVLRPRIFESMVFPEDEITQAALDKIQHLRQEMQFVDFGSIEDSVKSYKRAARLVFAVAQRTDIQNIDKEKVVYYAGNSNIDIEVDDKGVITPQAGSEVDFLEMLDRRIYNVEFIEGETEYYRADSRSRRR